VLDNAPSIAFFPAKLNQSLFSTFVQDEISLRDNVVLTVGTKLEHTAYTGFEYEPSARLQWSLTDQQTLWGAVSLAVRAPSRIDRDISQPDPAYVIVILKGGAAFQSETLLAYELGYRAQFNANVSGALSVFYNDYDDLRSTSVSPPDPVFNLPFPFYFENNLEGETYGFELSTTVQVSDRWQLRGSYRLLEEDIRVKAGRTDFNNALNETADPKHQFSVRSSVSLPANLGFDTGLRWVGKRIINNSGVPATVPSYVEMDARLAWDIPGPLELSIAGQNLLHDHHPEYGVPGAAQVQIGRSVYGKLAWRM
jgi:iron complex outermembrane receptor protein